MPWHSNSRVQPGSSSKLLICISLFVFSRFLVCSWADVLANAPSVVGHANVANIAIDYIDFLLNNVMVMDVPWHPKSAILGQWWQPWPECSQPGYLHALILSPRSGVQPQPSSKLLICTLPCVFSRYLVHSWAFLGYPLLWEMLTLLSTSWIAHGTMLWFYHPLEPF